MIDIQVVGSSSKGNAYLITDGRTPILLECGVKFKDIQRAIGFKTSDLAGCLITHEHNDHCAALKDVTKAGIDCYMSPGTAEAINHNHHRVKTVTNKQAFKLGTWTILPFDVQHDVSEPLGFLLANQDGEKLLFATDTYYIKYKFKGLTHVLVECNYSLDILNDNIATERVPKLMKKRLLRSHFSLENVKGFLKANDLSKVQTIYLLHLSDNNSDEQRFKEEVQALTGKPVYVA
ncbi:MBL fold metallo-hydrolase [Alkalibacillus almallahensis]|uniref:MBL fold metallo-hydrolase n=1 Tax=Alkalibacillus almallahensis TaxID=1379154 RepID=UPI001423D6DC|nr:MBL fold metallo-hydrolase [Alkalibacillus almallahensis]NIK12844.1 phosphoribosyl 1,2-cyclic phosphodiesterase [Alkalibacillus almallahensis]